MSSASVRRLARFKEGIVYGKFGRTKAYSLLHQKKIKAYKDGGRTMLDLDSIDTYHASLPEFSPAPDEE